MPMYLTLKWDSPLRIKSKKELGLIQYSFSAHNYIPWYSNNSEFRFFYDDWIGYDIRTTLRENRVKYGIPLRRTCQIEVRAGNQHSDPEIAVNINPQNSKSYEYQTLLFETQAGKNLFESAKRKSPRFFDAKQEERDDKSPQNDTLQARLQNRQ